VRSSRRPEDRSARLEWRRTVRAQSLTGRLARLRENEVRRLRRLAARQAARAAQSREQELARLIAEQARDDQRYRVVVRIAYLDRDGIAWNVHRNERRPREGRQPIAAKLVA